MAEENTFTEQQTKVFSEGEETGELTLRFYSETPHIPYMGINEYSEFMRQQPLTVTQNDDGTCTLTAWNGAGMVCDAEKDVINVQDWAAFNALPLPLEDKALGLKDSTVHYVRMTDITYEGEAKPVSFDFAKYGIAVYADENDVYLPVSTLSNMMTDIATNYLVYNGENLYTQRLDMEGSGPEGFYESASLKAEIDGEPRPEDIIKQSYADLCFNLDYFFGHPGKALLDADLAEKGLDAALEGLGEEGAEIKEGLHSTDLAEYLNTMNKLFLKYFSDGHTVFVGSSEIIQAPSMQDSVEFMGKIVSPTMESVFDSPQTLKQVRNMVIPYMRAFTWGDEMYREYGNTAIIRLDNFLPDEAAWDSFYKGEGEFPQDSLGNVITGLKKAQENPEIKNVIFDLTCNGGGCPDVMMAILAVTTGQTQLFGEDVVTGQKMTITFEADANFDGVYDEKDKEVKYDFNYGVMTTRYAFSCGNLFPIIIQEGGAVLLGEPSSGGSCCIQVGSDAEGLTYVMSSSQWRLTDFKGMTVENGCVVDMPIKAQSLPFVDLIAASFGIDDGFPSFMNYYDDEMLDEMMNDWFAGEGQLEDAA
ncbi:MAG: hypothetical protein J6D53_12650 [Blautia sp.]|nr:hypothetical protein [Blautia sp.]